MPSTEDFERLLIARIAEAQPIDEQVDHLLWSLLASVPGYSGRATDGVLFALSDVRDGRADARGVVIMSDQTVGPVRVELVLDASRTALLSGWIWFGDASKTIPYGSRAHRKLEKTLIANQLARFVWRVVFHRSAAGWSHVASEDRLPSVTEAHEHCSDHRLEIAMSTLCGCFYCCATFSPDEIDQWIDEDSVGVGQTALCPRCGIDSVIGSAMGIELSQQFLIAMHTHWF